MFCTKCGKDMVDSDKYCPSCGHFNEVKPKEVFCSNCGTKAENGEKFCGECGTKIEYPIVDTEKMKAIIFSDVVDKGTINVKNDNTFNPIHGNYQSSYRDNKKKSKIPVFAFIILLLFVGATLLFLSKDKIFNTAQGKRTIMVYMVGSDLESKYFAASRDIKEMTESGADFENVTLLIYTGGATKWHNVDIPADKHAIFKVNAEGITKLDEFDNSDNMTDPDNLSYFLKYGYDNFKAEHYALILWDHGGGPIYGYGSDEYHTNDSMTMRKLNKALQDSPFSGENKLEFIGFDACLMGSIEVANVISDYADYLIASEESEPALGWDYSFLGKISRDTETIDLGKNIIDSYYSYYSNLNVKGISLSMLKLSKIENVEIYLNKLFNKIDQNLDLDYSSISRSRRSSRSFGRVPSEEYFVDLVDLNDLLKNLPSYKYNEEISNLSNALTDLIIYQKTDLNDAYGVSIYFPYEDKKNVSISLIIYKNFNFFKEYYDFIYNFSQKLTGARRDNFNVTRSKITSTGEGIVSVELPQDVIDNYSFAEYVLFIKNKDNTYTPIYRGLDVDVKGNTMSTETSRKVLTVKDSEDNEMYLTAIEYERGIGYIKYFIPITLTRLGDNYDYEIVNAYLEYIVDDNSPNGYVGRVIPMGKLENNQMNRLELDINDFDIISFNSYSYNIFDGSGNYKSDWESSNKITNIQINTKDKYTVTFNDLDISKTYYALFKIEDSQGDSVYTNAVLVNNK